MTRAPKLFSFFAVSTFVLASLGFLALHAIAPNGAVFGALYRMFLYHEAHPLEYIGIVAVTYAIIATGCAIRRPNLSGRRRFAVIIVIMISSIVVASVPGGVLWVIHDMQAGYFTTGARFWSDLMWGASTGLKIGWLVVALSLPYNILGLVVGYFVTDYGFKLAAHEA